MGSRRLFAETGFLGACTAANIAFAQLAASLNGLLFLDTVGTAVAALRLGPWWGMLVGISTNALLSFAPCKQQFFNYLIVNAVCGLVWGVLGRSVVRFFKNNIGYGELILKIVVIGAVSGFVASMIALFTTFNFVWRLEDIDPTTFREWHMTDRYYRWLLTSGILNQDGTLLEVLRRDVIAILPDKIVSVAIGVLVIYYAFPQTEARLRSIEPLDFLRDKTGALVAASALCVATIALVVRGQVSIDPANCQVISFTYITAQRILWIGLSTLCAALAVAALLSRRRAPIVVEPTERTSIVKTAYRDLMTILGGLFAALIVLSAGGRQMNGAKPSELQEISFLMTEGFGVLAFFAVMTFLPGFLLRLFGRDPEVQVKAAAADDEAPA
jgi:hypothetical protein